MLHPTTVTHSARERPELGMTPMSQVPDGFMQRSLNPLHRYSKPPKPLFKALKMSSYFLSFYCCGFVWMGNVSAVENLNVKKKVELKMMIFGQSCFYTPPKSQLQSEQNTKWQNTMSFLKSFQNVFLAQGTFTTVYSFGSIFCNLLKQYRLFFPKINQLCTFCSK